MKVCILGVGRSGTTAIYSLLQEILIDQTGRNNIDFIYEPFLWDVHVFNGRYDEVIKHFQDMNSISIEGLYNHCHLPLFVENPMKLIGNRYLNKIFNGSLKTTLIKFIRANGRFRLLSEMCPECKYIFIIRNPLDVLNSAVIRFSLLGSEFHKDDWNRFTREVNFLYGKGTIDEEKINSQVEKEVLYWYYMNKYALESFEQSNNKPLIICYEDYVSRREFWVDKICDFIELQRKNIYYEYSQKIAGSKTIKNNLSRLEFDMLAVYLDKYKALLTATGVNHPIDLDKITSKYKTTITENNRKEIIIGRTPNSMNTHIQKLEGILKKKDDELGSFKKETSELEEKLRKREDEVFDSRKRHSQLEGILLTKEKDIAEVKKRIRELEGKTGKREDDIIFSRKRLSELEGELAAKNNEIVGLKKKKSELEEELAKRENVITTLTNEISIKKELLTQNESSLNGLMHKLVKVEASNQNLKNQIKEKNRLIRLKDDIIMEKNLENELLEKRRRKIYLSLFWKVGKFLKKVFSFYFGWITRLKKNSQGGMRTAFPALQEINNEPKAIKFGIILIFN